MLLGELPKRIDAKSLAQYIPHKGPMILLDFVEDWDDQHILCSTQSHSNKNNPLLVNQELSAVNVIEYAAQAASFHAVLTCLKYNKTIDGVKSQNGISRAFLAVVRAFSFININLATIKEKLIIYANNPINGSNLLQYDIIAKIKETQIASGQVTLVVEE